MEERAIVLKASEDASTIIYIKQEALLLAHSLGMLYITIQIGSYLHTYSVPTISSALAPYSRTLIGDDLYTLHQNGAFARYCLV